MLMFKIGLLHDRLLAIVNCSDLFLESLPDLFLILLKELTSVSIVNHLPHEDTCAVNYKNIANGMVMQRMNVATMFVELSLFFPLSFIITIMYFT